MPSEPFLKWPGGKRWAAPAIAEIATRNLTGTYYEPFVGGGAVFFQLQPRTAVLSDVNSDLINTYEQVRKSADELIAKVKAMPVSKEFYYDLRGSDPTCPKSRAARFLYLNRTAFADVYRLNAQGKFNVPYGGRTPDILWTEHLLSKAARLLANCEILTSDFEPVMQRARSGDVVYCDPTYTVAHDTNGFRRYNERNFAWSDQIRLAQAARAASQRGATVLISNAHHPTILELYSDAECIELSRTSCISRHTSGRRQVSEYLFLILPR